MTTSAASASSTHLQNHRPDDLIGHLTSTSYEIKLKALRELKNQIIGSRTKKLSFLNLGAVPTIVSILSSSSSSSAAASCVSAEVDSLLIQLAAAIGSFACGFDPGVKAVLDAGTFPHLFNLVSHPNKKVVDASVRSLRMIYQSKMVPKFDFLQEKNMRFLLSLLNSENENVTGLGASSITHSCETSLEQEALSDAGVLKRLISHLGGSLSQRDASLESLATIIMQNLEVISKFVGPESGRGLSDKITCLHVLDCFKECLPFLPRRC